MFRRCQEFIVRQGFQESNQVGFLLRIQIDQVHQITLERVASSVTRVSARGDIASACGVKVVLILFYAIRNLGASQ